MFRPSQINKLLHITSGSGAKFLPAVQTLQDQLVTKLAFSSGKSSEKSPPVLTEPWIPPYVPRTGESVETIKARLLYQSRKRGMLENGLLLSTFAAKFLDSMTEPDLRDYDRLINLPSNDWDIFYWATGVKPIPPEFDTPMMRKFISHVQNTNRESRIRQPDLKDEN